MNTHSVATSLAQHHSASTYRPGVSTKDCLSVVGKVSLSNGKRGNLWESFLAIRDSQTRGRRLICGCWPLLSPYSRAEISFQEIRLGMSEYGTHSLPL